MILRTIAVVLSVVAIAGCNARPSAPTRPADASATAESTAILESPPRATARAIPLTAVVGFWSQERDISLDDLRAVLLGNSPRWHSLTGDGRLVAALAERLGVTVGPRFEPADAPTVLQRVSTDDDVLGIVPAAAVTPRVQSLAVDGLQLFGTRRVTSLSRWPLVVTLDAANTGADAASSFDPATEWTLVAGGDVMLDRDVYRHTVIDGRGVDYPWDGGTVKIVGRDCCTGLGNALPVVERSDGTTTVRAIFQLADVALVNLEGPAPDDFVYHAAGRVFTFDPVLLEGLRHAGIDLVDLANNHVGNAGPDGIRQTIANLDRLDIAHVGAGSAARSARASATFSAGGVQVAVLGYDDVDDGDHATATRPGTAALVVDDVRADIAAARKAGAALVVVLTHWGVEYTARPTAGERANAAAIFEAGADLIIGSHSHWAGAIADASAPGARGNGLAFFSLGDLVFDIDRSEETLEGLVPELTFMGSRLVQVDIHPTLIVDLAQPNLLDQADSASVLERVRRASTGMLDW